MTPENSKQKTSRATTSEDFRIFLQREFDRRCEKNPAYSLRSFAAHLHISSSTLSQYMSGKRKLTQNAVKSLGMALSLEPERLLYFAEKSGKRDLRRKREVSSVVFEELDTDRFDVIANWHHDAILELVRLPSFQPDFKWVARALGLQVGQVRSAVERLQSLNLLKLDASGNWIDQSECNTTIVHNEFTSMALRKYQKDLLTKSLAAVDHVPICDRDHTSIMLTLRKSDLPKIKEKIKAMRRELADFIRESKVDHDEVYQICVSLFPVSQAKKKEKV